MAVYSNASHHNISVTISNCVYENNLARYYGGGLFLVLAVKVDAGNSQNDVLVEGTTFASNTARLAGGGLVLAYPEANVVNCTVTATAGGSIFICSFLGRKQITY